MVITVIGFHNDGCLRAQKKRVLTRSDLCAAHSCALLSEDARMAPLGVAFRGFVCVN